MSENFRVFAIGASSGGYRAVEKIMQDIPSGINAAFLIVIHSMYNANDSFVGVLKKHAKLPVKEVEHNMVIRPGVIYMGKSNYHLFAREHKILLSKGPRENLFRPSIDVLFRSVAVAFGHQCIGVLLTGRLNDGTSGMDVIKRCGGMAIIENPNTAEYRDMPLFAKESVDIDYVVNLEDIASVMVKVVNESLPPKKEIASSIQKENHIAMRIKSQIGLEEELGEQVPLSCASCGGPLWRMKESDPERYRCHVGHSFTNEALLQAQNSSLEEALWVSIRTLEEKRNLMSRMATEYERKGMNSLHNSYNHKIDEVSDHIKNIKAVLQLDD